MTAAAEPKQDKQEDWIERRYKDRLIPVTAVKTTPKNLTGRLRRGYMIQVAGDPNDPEAFIKGPSEVPLTAKIALNNMVKWDNVGEVKTWLREWHGIPVFAQQKRLTPNEEYEQALKTARDINVGKAATAAGMSKEEIAILGREIGTAIATSLAPVITKSVVEALGSVTDEEEPAPARPARRGRRR